MFLVLLPVAIAAVLWYGRHKPATPKAVGYSGRWVKVKAGAVEQVVRLSGTTAEERSVVLRAPYFRGRRAPGSSRDFGLVLEWLASNGAKVARGDRVAEFDNIWMQDRYNRYRAATKREVELGTMNHVTVALRSGLSAGEIVALDAPPA